MDSFILTHTGGVFTASDGMVHILIVLFTYTYGTFPTTDGNFASSGGVFTRSDGIFTHRLSGGTQQLLVGSTNYQSLCRYCYNNRLKVEELDNVAVAV